MAISGVSLIGYLLMGSGQKPVPVRETTDEPSEPLSPPPPLLVPTKVDDELRERFMTALRDIR